MGGGGGGVGRGVYLHFTNGVAEVARGGVCLGPVSQRLPPPCSVCCVPGAMDGGLSLDSGGWGSQHSQGICLDLTSFRGRC